MDKLSEQLTYWRAEKPDEHIMDDFIRKAQALEGKIESLQNSLNKADELHFDECEVLNRKLLNSKN